MTPTILAIDPGAEGAIAVLDGDSVILEAMPATPEGKLDMAELVRLLSHYATKATRTYLELAGMRPRQATQTTAAQSRAFGRIEGVLSALGARPRIVRPEIWSAAYDHGVTEKDKSKRYAAIKKARRGIAKQLYPGIDLRKNSNCEVPHSGMVDALLLADWAMKRHNEGRTP